MTTICFIVLNYNGFPETEKLIRSLLSWDHLLLDFQVIAVDNDSTDGSFEKLQKAFSSNPFVDVISSGKNGGYSYGNNFGARYAIEKYHPQYIAISNPDVEIEQETVVRLLETFRVDSRIAMCAPVMKSIDGSYRIYAQRLPTYLDDLKACSLKNRAASLIEDYQTLDHDRNMIVTEMLPGSFFVVRADCFEEIGMFDENVFMYCEERILGKRLIDAGYLSIKRKDLYYVHVHAVTTSKALSEFRRWKILLKSRLYYNKVYGNVGKAQLLILRVAMRLFLFELWVLRFAKSR